MLQAICDLAPDTTLRNKKPPDEGLEGCVFLLRSPVLSFSGARKTTAQTYRWWYGARGDYAVGTSRQSSYEGFQTLEPTPNGKDE